MQVCKITQEVGCFADTGGKAKPSTRVLPVQAGVDRQMTRELCAGIVARGVGIAAMSSTLVGVEYGTEVRWSTGFTLHSSFAFDRILTRIAIQSIVFR